MQQWSWVAHDELLTVEAQRRCPSLLGWAGPAYEQAALPSLSLLGCQFPVVVLPEDCLFNSNKISGKAQLPAVVHGFTTDKLHFGQRPNALAERHGTPSLLTSRVYWPTPIVAGHG